MNNKRWVQEGEKHILYFTPFYDETNFAEVFYEDDGGWCFSSNELKTHDGYLGSDTLEMAKSDVEHLLRERFADERDYYADLLKKFEEE